MPYVVEGLAGYEVTQDEAELLEEHGFVVASSEFPRQYETTALVWDDFNLQGDRAFRLFDLLLGRKESRAEV